MTTATRRSFNPKPPPPPRAGVLGVLWREASRPFRPRTWLKWRGIKTVRKDKGINFPFFSGSVEPAGLEFLAELVRRSRNFPGPIIEIGTLFGRTATHIALHKAPEQKIITVDTYTWNGWGLSRESHFQLTSGVLHYLVQTGHVIQLRQNKNEFYDAYDGPPPSLVFLDAIHTYEQTKIDIEWAKSVGAAMITGHDYSKKFPGVQQIVHEHGGPKEVGGTVFLL
jgi:hypothetical protein